MVLDETGQILSANAMALSDFGYERAELVGRQISDLLPGPSPDGYAALLERHRWVDVDTIVGTGLDVEGVRRGGSTFPAHVGLMEFLHGGRAYYLCACRDTTERREYRNLVDHRARHDRSTGCLNRFGVEDYLDRVTERAPEQSLAVAYVALDGLARAGEAYPRDIEAGLLPQAVTRLQGVLREHGKLARVGRNDFVAVMALDDVGSLSITDLGQRLVASLEAPLEAAGWQVAARASVGISLHPDHGRTPATLIDRAEAAMHHARRSRTSEAQFFDVADQRRDNERSDALERIRAAVERSELTLHYQPQFDLPTLRTTGLEALLRWQHPDKGLIPPGEFLPLLEAAGLMPTVSRWVLSEALAANARLIGEGILDVPVGVNIGPEIFEDPSFPELVSSALHHHGVAADRLEVEITEATAITDPEQVAANAEALRALGVGVAIDDYGTGFSSLKRLRVTQFSKLKIDRAFVAVLPGEPSDRTVITALLDLADGLNMDAVAEGIETEQQLDYLRRLGCRFGQGFWYARPMPEEDLHTWSRR